MAMETLPDADEAGAADDKLVAQISPLLIPPFNGTNTRKAKVTADVRCETSYALSPVGCTVMHTDTATAQRTARYALEDSIATKSHSMLTSYELSPVGCTSYIVVCTPVCTTLSLAAEGATAAEQRVVRYTLKDINATNFYSMLTSFGLSSVGCTSYCCMHTNIYCCSYGY
jgi:hypothetical protein